MSRFTVRSFLALALTLCLHAKAFAGDPPPPSTWLTEVQEQIDASEYEIRPDREGIVQGPNRAHGFRTLFLVAAPDRPPCASLARPGAGELAVHLTGGLAPNGESGGMAGSGTRAWADRGTRWRQDRAVA